MQIKDMTPAQALTQCLLLGLTAPSDEQAAMAGQLADELAVSLSLSESQIEICKINALAMWSPKRV